MNFSTPYISFVNVVRYTLIIGGVFWAGLGHLIQLRFGDVSDPMWVRYIISILIIGLGISSFMISYPKKLFYRLSTFIFLGISIWSIILDFKNSGIPYYTTQLWIFCGLAATLLLPADRYWLFALIMLLGFFFGGISFHVEFPDQYEYIPGIILMLLINGLILSIREQATKRLRAMAHLSEQGPIPIFEVSSDGNIKFVNQKFCSLLGHDSGEVLGTSIFELIESSNAKEVYEGGWLIDTIRTRELYFKRKKGDLLPALVSLSPYDENDDRTATIIGTITDITALKEVEHQLKERNEQMDLFLYKATHDLKGPLASVKGILNIAVQSCQQPDIEQYMQMALTSTDKLDQALVDLLHVTRLNKADLIIEEVNCNDLVEEILFSLQHMPESRMVQFEVEIQYKEIFYTDKNTLTTILQNLIVNAIKYKREEIYQHVVFVGIKKYGNGIKVEVRDNGEGIRPEIQEKIFNMFYRGNKKSKGTGLGLYIVKQGVDKLAGELYLKSKPGSGTVFMLYIPSYRKKNEIPNQLLA